MTVIIAPPVDMTRSVEAPIASVLVAHVEVEVLPVQVMPLNAGGAGGGSLIPLGLKSRKYSPKS